MLGTLAVLTLYRSTHRVAEQLRAVATSCDPTARAAADHAAELMHFPAAR